MYFKTYSFNVAGAEGFWRQVEDWWIKNIERIQFYIFAFDKMTTGF
jgi:hypothetical protein